MAARSATTASHDKYDAAARPQRSPSLGRATKSAASQPTEPRNGPAADPTAPSSALARSPSARSFDMTRHSSRSAPLEDVLDMDLGSFRVPSLHRSPSAGSGLSRGNTLKRQKSLSRKSSLRRSSSARSIRAGSIGNMGSGGTDVIDHNSVFYTPIPTSGSPTEILANRFQAWRKLLKDLISYFKEVQSSYEQQAKAFMRLNHTASLISTPNGFRRNGGIGAALHILRSHHQEALDENLKAREIVYDVIAQLNELRSDLGQKIKEIKSLSGDFKNSIEKEKEATKRMVGTLEEALAAIDTNARALVGKEDPYILRLAVERQVERQIEEENYLHRAYLNLEGSGRELEAIVVVEIQKAFNAFATILRAEADYSYETVEALRNGPISMPKDLEWAEFIERDAHFISPNTPLREAQYLEYPGKYHAAAVEVRAGMLERKSKYLKSYSPGWYVLSATHLHEFRSPEAVHAQSPVVSLYLPDQALGAHSQPTSSSHKFILKGRQTGGLHRGHSWVFRAESRDTMLAWYEDIKNLTEKKGEERYRFVRGHSRNYSTQSARSVSSLEEDEADRVPYSPSTILAQREDTTHEHSPRPEPGGRFPSGIQLRQDLPARISASSDSTEQDHDANTTATQVLTQRGVSLQNGSGPVGSSEPQKAAHRHAFGGAEDHGGPKTGLGLTMAGSQDERTIKNQEREEYAAPAELPSTSIATRTNTATKNTDTNTATKAEPPQRPTTDGRGIKSRFTEILADDPVIGRHHPSLVEPNGVEYEVNPTGRSQKMNLPQLETAVAVGLSGLSPTPSTKPNQSTEPEVELVARAVHSPVEKTPKMVALPREIVREAASRQEASRLNSLHKQDVNESTSPEMSKKNTDMSIGNLPVPGQFPRPVGS